MPSGHVLVTGPARSGKSEWAERLARESGLRVCYVATAREDADDPEWSARIARHQRRRPADWHTVLAPTDLAGALARHAAADQCLLVDALGTWVANCLAMPDDRWQHDAVNPLVEQVACCPGQLLLVAEETGWGLVPLSPEGRLFRDRLGALIRTLGPRCSASYLVTGGFALDLTRLGVPIA